MTMGQKHNVILPSLGMFWIGARWSQFLSMRHVLDPSLAASPVLCTLDLSCTSARVLLGPQRTVLPHVGCLTTQATSIASSSPLVWGV